MSKILTTSLLALAAVLMLATGALAQSTVIKGKVVGPDDQPIVGVAVLIELMTGVAQAHDQDRQARRVHPVADRGRAVSGNRHQREARSQT